MLSCIRVAARVLLIAPCFVLSSSVSWAQLTLLRGPYLQSAAPHTMIVRWRTDFPSESIVFYGNDPDHPHFVAGNLDLTTEHEVQLAGLTPETKYYYAVGSLDEILVSGDDYFFKTTPPLGARRPIRIWAIGDCGTAQTGAGDQIGVRNAYYNFADGHYTDLCLALGDNAYYDGTDDQYQTEFFDIYQDLFRHTVIWSTVGNHETGGMESNGKLAYFNIFSFPTGGEAGGIASGTENYYSFDHGNIHFVCLDSMIVDRSPGSEMLRWLQADLAANTNEWLIAFFHHPPYTMGSHNSDTEISHIEMRENALPILESYGVDLVLGGHSHIYERSMLLHGHYGYMDSFVPEMIRDAGTGRPSEGGAYYKGGASAGANEGTVYVVTGSSGWATYRNGHHSVMIVDELEMGSVVLDIDGPRLDATFLRETGAIDDTFTIIKDSGVEPLRITQVRREQAQAILQWRSIAGEQYEIQQTTALQSEAWQAASDTIMANRTLSSWTNTIPPGPEQRFFRIRKPPD